MSHRIWPMTFSISFHWYSFSPSDSRSKISSDVLEIVEYFVPLYCCKPVETTLGVHLISPHLLFIPFFSFIFLLPSSPSCFPLPRFLGLLSLVEAFLVDTKPHTADEGQDHNHNSSYRPHRHWGRRKGFKFGEPICLFTSSNKVSKAPNPALMFALF